MKVTKDICYVGVNDHEIDLFEGLYDVPDGMAYNSYVIMDDKIAVMDTVEQGFGEIWLQNVKDALKGRAPDYLVIQHMEPDHSANILRLMETYPQTVAVASAKAFAMMKGFFGTDFAERRMIVKEGDVLCLGRHELSFFAAPMVHWPEVIVTYDSADKVLFAADAFGKFGALDTQEDWADEARRYYFGIVGKYGAQTQSLLKKAAKLDIERICSLHGPVLEGNLETYLNLYDTWSSYRAESEGVVIACASIYGNTKRAAERLAERLRESGCASVVLYDLARCDMAKAVADAFRFDKLVLASATYNADVFPPMKTFIHRLTERGFQGRTVALIENGAWAPMAAKVMRAMLEGCKNIAFAENAVKLNCAMNEASEAQIDALARELTGK